MKCSTYGILFWLPSYAKYNLGYDHTDIKYIAISYDVGVIMGNVVIGRISDLLYNKRAPVAFTSLFLGSLSFFSVVLIQAAETRWYTKLLMWVVIFFVGFFVGSIFNVIAATAAADLAKGEGVKGNKKAIATLSGILDGSGSFGAAVGSYVIGAIRRVSWNGMFIFLA